MEQLGLQTEWWNTPRIAQKILGHLTHQEILALSSANKKLNSEAKSVLKENGKTLAKLGRVGHYWDGRNNACHDFLKIANLLEGMEVVPFARFNIIVTVEHSEYCATLDEALLQLIESRIPARILRITAHSSECERYSSRNMDFQASWDSTKRTCKALQAVDRLLLANANQLEEISMVVPSILTFNIQSFTNIRGFPQLKIFKLDFHKLGQPNMALFFDFLKIIVKSAPRLEELSLEQDRSQILSRSWLKEMVGKGSRAHLVYDEIGVDLLQIPISCLEHVAVRSFKDPFLRPGNQIFPAAIEARRILLRSSWNTLKRADLDVVSITEIIQHGIPFPKLDKISMNVMLP